MPASLQLGNSTEEAVFNGALSATVALIENTLSTHAGDSGAVTVYLTGGDADALAASVTFPMAEVIPNLVLDGLAIACPYLPEKV